jgi:hypothetical protein
MLPIKHKSIFKSRWIALLWAAGIVWSAVEFTGGQHAGDGNDANGSETDTQAAINALGGVR